MTTNKTTKDVILLSCHDVPESICVETQFIPQSAVNQLKNERVFHLTNNGNFELIRKDQVLPTTNIPPLSIPRTYSRRLPEHHSLPGIQSQLLAQPQSVGTVLPLVPALINVNNNGNVMNNLTAGPILDSSTFTSLRSACTTKTINLNNTNILSATTVGNANAFNIANVTRSFRDKIQQTDISAFNKKSVSIQCKFDEEQCDLDFECSQIYQDVEAPRDHETEKQILLSFIGKNSTQYKEYKECLICGELCKSNKYFYGHMAIHKGPKVLCDKCGIILDHEALSLNHKCRHSRKLEKALLQCPNYKCSVKAISLLELYDHINEHGNNRMYKCSSCRKSFCTGEEFVRHILIRAKCYTSAKRKRFRVYGLESQKDYSCRVRVFTLHTFKKRTILVKTFLSKREAKQGICNICLKAFANKSVYKRHRFKCMAKFQKRLSRKVFK